MKNRLNLLPVPGCVAVIVDIRCKFDEIAHPVIDEAAKAKEEGKEKVILFNYSGHGLMDLSGYDAFLAGKLTDYELPQQDLDKFTAPLKNLPKAEARKTGKW